MGKTLYLIVRGPHAEWPLYSVDGLKLRISQSIGDANLYRLDTTAWRVSGGTLRCERRDDELRIVVEGPFGDVQHGAVHTPTSF